jgi:hypothetical protein
MLLLLLLSCSPCLCAAVIRAACVATVMPGEQKPHCVPWNAANLSMKCGCNNRGSDEKIQAGQVREVVG